MLGFLLKFIIKNIEIPNFEETEIIVITDKIEHQKKREAIEKTTKITLKAFLPKGTKFKVFHHDSKAHYGIQIADYCTWAIQRKWKDNDRRSYNLIKEAIKSESDIFSEETTIYY